MILWMVVVAAAALSLERAGYVWIARAPHRFRRWCARPAVARLGQPVDVVRKLFYGFKAVQFSVFAGWCELAGRGALPLAARPVVPLAIGGALMVVGQVLNLSVFYRLGAAGVFYGDRLGLEVARCDRFPFSRLSHPQYVGTVLSIWGFFAAVRFPHADWVVLPVLETVYYVVGTCLEERCPRRTVAAATRARTAPVRSRVARRLPI